MFCLTLVHLDDLHEDNIINKRVLSVVSLHFRYIQNGNT